MATFDGNAVVAQAFSQTWVPGPILMSGTTNSSGSWSGDDQIYGSDPQSQTHVAGGSLWYDDNLGRDTLNGGDGNDYIDGRAGNDTITGGNGMDTIVGGAGNDTLQGNAGDDTINGGDNNDTIHGGADNDFLNGDNGNDFVSGDLGADFVHGNAGNDSVYGGDGNDTVLGGSGDDQVYGEGGNDHLSGDIGTDVMTGGAGADEFNFALGYGNDTVTDFNQGEGDHVLISSGTYSASQVGAHTVVTLSDGGTLTLLNTTLSTLSSGWII